MHEQTYISDSSASPTVHATRFGLLRLLDLPRLVFAVLFFWLLFAIELNDPDYFWHLKAGEYIVEHMAVPSGDPFSYTFQGQPWPPSEWLFEVGLYAVFALLGTAGVKLLTALLGVLSIYTVYRAANRLLGASTLALALAIIFFAALPSYLTPRPQLVTYVLFALVVNFLIAFKYFGDDRRLWLIPPLLVLWVNMHGGYAAGIAVLGLFCVCEWLICLTTRASLAQRRRLLKLSLIAAGGALATAINPDGIGGWLFPLQMMDMDYAKSVVAEWKSPNFQLLYAKLYLVLVFGYFMANIYRQSKPDVTEIALPLLVVFAGFVGVRHVPLALLILVPFVAVALREGPVLRFYGSVCRSGKQLGNAEYLLNWTLLCVIGMTFYLLNPTYQAKAQARLNEAMPVKAVDFVKRHGITGRMFNEYDQGGYLIYRLYPQQQVFIDGRWGSTYSNEFVKEFVKIRDGAPGWDKAFDKYAIDYLIVRRDAPLRERLLSRGDFKMVYYDDAYSVLVRRLPRFDQLAEQKAE